MMADPKDKKDNELKLQPGQSMEEFVATLKQTLREREEAIEQEREERKRKGDENSELRKKLRQTEEEKREITEHQRVEGQKSLEEQGRYKDLWQESERRRKEAEEKEGQRQKELDELKMTVTDKDAKLNAFQKREAERVEGRFARLPEEVRKRNSDLPVELKDRFVTEYEFLHGTRPPGAPPPLGPPSGLGPTGNFVREEDVEAMPQKKREEYLASPEFRATVEEGRLLRRGRSGPR